MVAKRFLKCKKCLPLIIVFIYVCKNDLTFIFFRMYIMPFSYGHQNLDQVHWSFIPNEVLNYGPFLHAIVLIIRPGVQSGELIIPTLKMFKFVNSVIIHFEQISGITDFPNKITSLALHNTNISTLPNLPHTIKHLRLTNNKNLTLNILPPILETFECYGQTFGTIRVSRYLKGLLLFGCTFTSLTGIDYLDSNQHIGIFIQKCICPYPSCELNLADDKTQYFNEMYHINRSLRLDVCLPLAELRIKSLNDTHNSQASISQNVIRSSSNYPLRIAEFLV